MVLPPREIVVVVGNGMVGFKFCQLLSELDARRRCPRFEIIVFGEESVPAYDRVNLTNLLFRKLLRELLLADRGWYATQGIKLCTGERVVAINRSSQSVRTSRGRLVVYDHLVLATGSMPVVPAIPGSDHAGVLVYRTPSDLKDIGDRARSATRAAVLGGGLLGLEVAAALRALKLETHLVTSRHLMSRHLDVASAHLLEQLVEEQEIDVHCDASVKEIRRDQGQLVVDLGYEEIGVDFVVLTTGVRARDHLARQSGLEVAELAGGVIVNDALQTSDEHILAIGECANHRGVVYGMLGPGNEMAKVAALNLCGEQAFFLGSDMSCRLTVAGIDVAVLGGSQFDDERETFVHGERRRTLFLENERIVGACAIGRWNQLWQIKAAIDTEKRIRPKQIERFRLSGDLWPSGVSLAVVDWPSEALVCTCQRVSVGELKQAIARGHCTVAALRRQTLASSVCGSCEHLVAELCGEAPSPGQTRGWRLIFAMSAAALVTAVAFVVVQPLYLADAVEHSRYTVARLWSSSGFRHVTGFALLGASALALILPLRKRFGRFRGGTYSYFRAFHVLVGLTAAAMVVVHTGVRLGDNLNRALSIAFLGVILTGAFVGIGSAAEGSGLTAAARMARRARPFLLGSHWLLLWLFPVLVTFHIITALYF